MLRDGADGILPYELVVQKLNITRTVVRALEEQKVLALESRNMSFVIHWPADRGLRLIRKKEDP